MCNPCPGSHSCDSSTDQSLSEAGLHNSEGGVPYPPPVDEAVDFEELQLQLFLREIQHLNPSLRDGCLFVDGLYGVVCSRLPVQSTLKCPFRSDLLSLHPPHALLLQQYWHKPHDPSEQATYLTIATSFVSYVLSNHGPQGVHKFLQELDATVDDPLDEKFCFDGQDIVTLEFGWRKFVEAEVSVEFHLSVPAMLRTLFTHHLIRYWPLLLVVLALMVAEIAMELTYSIAFVQLIALGYSSLFGTKDVLQWFAILTGALLLRFGMELVSATILSSMAIRVGYHLRKAVCVQLGVVTPLFFAAYSTSNLIMVFSTDIVVIEKLISSGLRDISIAFLLILCCFFFTLSTAWPLAVYLAGLFFLSQLATILVSSRLGLYQFTKDHAIYRLCNILREQADGFLENKVYQLSNLWEKKMENIAHSYCSQHTRKALFFSSFALSFQDMRSNISLATVLFMVILLVHGGRMDFTTGLDIFLLYIRVSIALTAAVLAIPQLKAASTALGRVNAILSNRSYDIKPFTLSSSSSPSSPSSSFTFYSAGNYIPFTKGQEIASGEDGAVPGGRDESGGVKCLPFEFRGLCFRYQTTAIHWDLFNISLKISPGEHVAVVGRRGSGKTTLLMLALQLFLPSEGEVIIGDSGSVLDCDGRPKISATFKRNHIFNMSVRENIRLGCLTASNEEVEAAARKAQIHDWIMTLPRSYDTLLHAGSSSLARRERQRLAIARMLVTRTPVFLLDEVESALNPTTGKKVFENLIEVMRGHTLLVVTQNLEYAQHFNRIVVLSCGCIKEVGTHTNLLAHRGVYWTMWNQNTHDSLDRLVALPQRSMLCGHQAEELPLPSELLTVPLYSARQEISDQSYLAHTLIPLDVMLETRENPNPQMVVKKDPLDLSLTCQEPPSTAATPATTTTPRPSNAASPTTTAAEGSFGCTPYMPRRTSTPKISAGELANVMRKQSEHAVFLSNISSLPPHIDNELTSSALVTEPEPYPTVPGVQINPELKARSFEPLDAQIKPSLRPYELNQTLPAHLSDVPPLPANLIRCSVHNCCGFGSTVAESSRMLGRQLEQVVENDSPVYVPTSETTHAALPDFCKRDKEEGGWKGEDIDGGERRFETSGRGEQEENEGGGGKSEVGACEAT